MIINNILIHIYIIIILYYIIIINIKKNRKNKLLYLKSFHTIKHPF